MVPRGQPNSRAAGRLAVQITEHHGQPITAGQTLDLLVQDRLQIVPHEVRCIVFDDRFNGQRIRLANQPGTGTQGDAIRDLVEPARHRPLAADALGLPHQREKRGLKGVLRLLLMPQHSQANAQHHGSMSPDENLERGLVAGLDEALQELAIREARRLIPIRQAVDLPQYGAKLATAHEAFLASWSVHQYRAGVVVVDSRTSGRSLEMKTLPLARR
jgi:hypothetical protein